MKRFGRGSMSHKGGASVVASRKAVTSDPMLRPVCRWSRQQLVYWLTNAGLNCLLPLLDEESEVPLDDLSPEASIFAKHDHFPNLLRLSWLPSNKIPALIGLPADDDLRKIFVYEDFIKDLVVVQTMLISPRDLLNGFEERMHKPVPLITLEGEASQDAGENISHVKHMEAISIIDYLKYWISFDGHHEMANDPALLKMFNVFCDLHVSPINSSDAKLLKADVKARMKHRHKKDKEKEKDRKAYYTSAAPTPREPSKTKHLTLQDIHPEELARQLTLMEEDIFIQIRPKEFLKQAWNKGNHELNAPFITQLTRNFNKLINWITTEVLKHQDAATRADTITKFIKTAKYLEKLKNYNGVMQVLSSLHSSAISRLKQSWALIPPKANAHFNRITALMSNLSNFKVFREAYGALDEDEPCIPFLAVFLTDCTYMDDTMNDKNENGRFNWDKMSTMATKIRDIRRFGMRRFDLVPVYSIQHYISSAESWNDTKTLYAISQLAEGTNQDADEGPKKTDARKAYSKFNRVTVANMNLRSMYLKTDTGTGDQNVLSQRDWKILLTGATLTTYNDGEVVLDIGTTNDRLFRIKSGMVKVHKQSVNTPPVATMGKEEMFGEISMLLRGEDGTTTAAIVASGIVEIWEIAIDFVLKMCEGDHILSEKLHRIIAVKLASRLKSLNTAKRTKGSREGRMSRSLSRQALSAVIDSSTQESALPSSVALTGAPELDTSTKTTSKDSTSNRETSSAEASKEGNPKESRKLRDRELSEKDDSNVSETTTSVNTLSGSGSTQVTPPSPGGRERPPSAKIKMLRTLSNKDGSGPVPPPTFSEQGGSNDTPLNSPAALSPPPSRRQLSDHSDGGGSAGVPRGTRSPKRHSKRVSMDTSEDSFTDGGGAMPVSTPSAKDDLEESESLSSSQKDSSSHAVSTAKPVRHADSPKHHPLSKSTPKIARISESPEEEHHLHQYKPSSSLTIGGVLEDGSRPEPSPPKRHSKKSSNEKEEDRQKSPDLPRSSTPDRKSKRASGSHEAPTSPSPSSKRAQFAATSAYSTTHVTTSSEIAAPSAVASVVDPGRSSSPGKSLSSWKGRVSAALLPRRSPSSSSDGSPSGGGASGNHHKSEKSSDKSDRLDKSTDSKGSEGVSGADSPSSSNRKSGKSSGGADVPEADRQDVVFRKRFKLKDNLILLRSFECAVKGTIVTHGTLFISASHWCFGARVFGMKTSEVLRIESITDVEHSGKYIIIKHGSKSLKLLGFDAIEETHSFLKSLWEKFSKPAPVDSITALSGGGGSLVRRNSNRFNRSAILQDVAAASSSSSINATSASAASTAASSSATPLPSESLTDFNGYDDDDDEDIASKFELTSEDWAKILKGANLVAFQKGDHVIKEGDQFQRVFQLLRGSACIQKEINGVMTVLGRLTAEDGIFGEISFLEGGSATASIVADEPDTAVYIIEGYFLNVYFERNPGVSGRFFHFLAHLLSKRIKAREALQGNAKNAAPTTIEMTQSSSEAPGPAAETSSAPQQGGSVSPLPSPRGRPPKSPRPTSSSSSSSSASQQDPASAGQAAVSPSGEAEPPVADSSSPADPEAPSSPRERPQRGERSKRISKVSSISISAPSSDPVSPRGEKSLTPRESKPLSSSPRDNKAPLSPKEKSSSSPKHSPVSPSVLAVTAAPASPRSSSEAFPPPRSPNKGGSKDKDSARAASSSLADSPGRTTPSSPKKNHSSLLDSGSDHHHHANPTVSEGPSAGEAAEISGLAASFSAALHASASSGSPSASSAAKSSPPPSSKPPPSPLKAITEVHSPRDDEDDVPLPGTTTLLMSGSSPTHTSVIPDVVVRGPSGSNPKKRRSRSEAHTAHFELRSTDIKANSSTSHLPE